MASGADARVVSRGPCPACGSRDNLVTYDDGHSHCFGMGCGHHTAGDGDTPTRSKRMAEGLLQGDFVDLPPRALTADACRKFGVHRAKMGEATVVAMNYVDQNGTVVAQKVRLPADASGKKRFTILGDASKMGLFGQHLWAPGGRKVVVTEGELDAVALCQAQGLKWPTVSVPNGASNARKAIAAAREWLETFDEVVLAFDADEVGRQAVEEAAGVLTPGKVRIADFGPYGWKDANEAVIKCDERGLLDAIWKARVWRPDGIVSLKDIRDRVLTPLEPGTPWPWPSLTDVTHGRRLGELHGIGAGTGIGKSDLLTQVIAHDVGLGIRCGVLSLEQPVAQTGRRIAGKIAGKRFHVSDGSWEPGELQVAWDALEATDLVRFYDNFGAMDWGTIKSRMLYMHEVEGCQHIFLDHLTALAAGEDDENKALKGIMADMSSIAKGRFVLHFISHLSTPEGKSHEEGGRVTIKHFRGSRTIGYWTHFLYGLERDQQADSEEERAVTTLRCLKDRETGDATGKTIPLRYDRSTGLLSEDTGFGDETQRVTADAAGF